MPTWVYNSLAVSGNKKQLTKMVSKLNEPFESNLWQFSKIGEYVQEITKYSNPVFSFRNIICPTDLDSYYSKPEFNKPTGNGRNDLIEGIATGEDWYRWNLRNWGTKWDIAVSDGDKYPDTRMEQQDEDLVMYYFSTAWSPVDSGMLVILSEMYPLLEFYYRWEEEQGWGGEAKIADGTFVVTKAWDIPASHAEALAIRDYYNNCKSYSLVDLENADENDLEEALGSIYEDCPTYPAHKEALDKLQATRDIDEDDEVEHEGDAGDSDEARSWYTKAAGRTNEINIQVFEEIQEKQLQNMAINLFNKIQEINADSNADPQEIIERLIEDVHKKVLSIAPQLLEKQYFESAYLLLGEFVDAQAWLEADYGPDGFYHQHTEISYLLFDFGKTATKEFARSKFDEITKHLSFAVGLALNSELTNVLLEKLLKEVVGEADPDIAIFTAALLCNANLEHRSDVLDQLSVEEVGMLISALTGFMWIFGNSTENLQFALSCEPLDERTLMQFISYVTEYVDDNEMFNENVAWGDLVITKDELNDILKGRLDDVHTTDGDSK